MKIIIFKKFQKLILYIEKFIKTYGGLHVAAFGSNYIKLEVVILLVWQNVGRQCINAHILPQKCALLHIVKIGLPKFFIIFHPNNALFLQWNLASTFIFIVAGPWKKWNKFCLKLEKNCQFLWTIWQRRNQMWSISGKIGHFWSSHAEWWN